MSRKRFGVDEVEVFGSGTPSIEVPDNLLLEAKKVAISTDVSIGRNLTVSGISTLDSLDVNSLDASGLTVSGISTYSSLGVSGVTTTKNLEVIGVSTFHSDIKCNDFIVVEKGEWYMPVGYARTMTAQVGTGITNLSIGIGATRNTDAAIYNYCWDNYEAFDLDGDGIVSSIDTFMLFRYVTGSAYGGHQLITGSSGENDFSHVHPASNATRISHEEIRRHLSKYDRIANTGVLYTNTEKVLSGIITSSSTKVLGVGIAVTGTGIPAGTTVTGIGTTTVTISQAVTQTETNATVYFGNGVLDIDGNGTIESLTEPKAVIKVFGTYMTSVGDSFTVKDLENFNFSNSSYLSPDDGGGAQFRSVGTAVGIGTNVPSTSNLQNIELGSGVYLNGSAFGKVVSVGSTDISQLSKLSTSNNWDISLGISTTVPNPESGYCNPGQSGFISVAQTAGGGKVLSWGSYWDFADGIAPTLSSGANDVNVIGYYVRSNTSIVADTITDIG